LTHFSEIIPLRTDTIADKKYVANVTFLFRLTMNQIEKLMIIKHYNKQCAKMQPHNVMK